MSDIAATSLTPFVAEESLRLTLTGAELEGLPVTNAKRIRRETLNGKAYLVADAILLTPGVHEGSEGPILYTAEGNVANASDWEDQPLVVYHPMKDGKFVTVKSDPSILTAVGIGMVKNAQGTKDGRLKAKLWFEEEATKRVDMRVYNSLVDGKTIELSTGLLLERKKAPEGSVYNGTDPYTEVAGKHVPDHVAILPDQEGACAIRKGCGVLVNQLSEASPIEEKKSVWRKIGEYLGIITPTPVTNEAVRHSELRAELARQIKERFEKGPMGATLASYVYTYVEDVFDHKVIFTRNDEILQLSYTKNNKTGEISLGSEDPIKVRRVVSYKPIDSGSGVVSNQQPEDVMDRDAIITELVTNCDCWKHQGDKEVLNSFSDDKLLKLKEGFDNHKRLTEVVNVAKKGFEAGETKYVYNESTRKFEATPTQKKAETVTANTNPTTTANASGTAPVANRDQQARLTPEEQEDLAFARNQKNQMRTGIINRLVANAREEERTDLAQTLAGKSLADLQLMEKFLPPEPIMQPNQDQYPIPMANPVANFFGIQGGPAPITPRADLEEEVYAPPVMNFSTEKGADGVVRTTTSW